MMIVLVTCNHYNGMYLGILRAHHRRDGWDSLSLEEMQWVMLDQALNPTKYEWLREQEESEAQLLHDVGKEYVKAKNLAAVDMYRFVIIYLNPRLRSVMSDGNDVLFLL